MALDIINQTVPNLEGMIGTAGDLYLPGFLLLMFLTLLMWRSRAGIEGAAVILTAGVAVMAGAGNAPQVLWALALISVSAMWALIFKRWIGG